MTDYRELQVWQRSIALATEIHRFTGGLPDSEGPGLTEQMRRASVSIASSIAEGAARENRREFMDCLYRACGSANALDTQLEISKELDLGGYVFRQELMRDTQVISKMLRALINRLEEGPDSE